MKYVPATVILYAALSMNWLMAQGKENDVPAAPIPIARLSQPIVFDGIPDEEAWQMVPAFPMVMLMPVPGKEPTEASMVKAAYDDEFFYLSCDLHYKDIRQLRAIGKKRDYSERSSCFFGFILDTFNDRENAVVFYTNPHGLRLDATIKNDCENEDSDFNSSWNTFWNVRTHITEKGWSAEFRIPFSSLRFQATEGMTSMGILIMRWNPAKPEMATFPAVSPRLGSAQWRPSLSQEISFEGLQPRRPLYITPYLLTGLSQLNELNTAGTAYGMQSTPKLDAGGDLKYSLTNNLTLDVTVNTDFAQVEADDQKINLTRYSLYFPEKRVFFMEKADVFDFPFLDGSNLFYSRRIGLHEGNAVRIYGGTRITGRVNRWDVGLLNMQTASFREHPGENFGAIRLKRNVLNPYSYAGAMVTSRLGADGSWNLAYGLDGQFRAGGDEYFTVRMAQSFEDAGGGGPFDMAPVRLLLQWQRRSLVGLGYDVTYHWAGEGYNPGIGFERKRQFHGPAASVMYGWWPGANSFLMYHRLGFSGHYFLNTTTGVHETTNASVDWHFNAKALYGGSFTVNWYQENLQHTLILGNNQASVPAGAYSFAHATAGFSTSVARDLSASFSATTGRFFDGWRMSFYAGPKLKIGSDYDVGLTYYLDFVEFGDRDMRFTNHIIGFKGLMTLTTQTSLAAFIQYNTAIDRVVANLRFRLNPREGNDLYIVYDEGLNTDINRLDPSLPRSAGRTVLLKYTYTFRL
jgi:hypothetical protein